MNSPHHKTVVGLFMASAVVFGSKLMSLGSQWILGFYLAPHEFGMYGMIIGAMAFVGFMQDPGLGRIHTQMQCSEGHLWRKSLFLSQAFSWLGAVVLVLIVAAFYEDDGQLFLMAIISALSFPLIGFYSLWKSRLEIGNDYKSIAQFQLLSSLVNSISVVILAIAGAGSLSFSIALFVSAVCTASYVKLASNKKPIENTDEKLRCNTRNYDEGYNKKLIWALVGSFVLGFSLRSDYFVVGLSLDSYDLGVYYFGFMLAANVGLLLSQAMGSVLMPAFSSLNKDGSSHRIYLSACRKLLFLGVYVSIFAALLLPYIIEWLWGDKWIDSIVVCQFFLLTLPLKLLVPVSLAYMESQAKWGERAVCLAIDGVTLAFFCYLGAIYGGLIGAVIGSAFQRGTVGLVTFYWAQYQVYSIEKIKGQSRIFNDILVYGLFISLSVVSVWQSDLDMQGQTLVGVACLFGYFLVSWWFSSDVYRSIYSIFKRFWVKI